MANAKLTHQTWTVEIRFGEGEAPDVKKSYSSIVVRPYAATVKFWSTDTTPAPRIDSVLLHGHRVNKSGLGVTVDARIYSHELPEWLTPAIDQAKGIVNG